MTFDIDTIEQIHRRLESKILGVDGVAFVATGVDNNGNACLLIGTSVPVMQVHGRLPKELDDINVELRYVGDISTQ